MAKGSNNKISSGVLKDNYAHLTRNVETALLTKQGIRNNNISQKKLKLLYENNPFVERGINLFPQDCLRNGRTWETDVANIAKINEIENKLGWSNKQNEAIVKARLYGGAVILIDTLDDDLSLPLLPENVNADSIIGLKVFTRYDFRDIEVGKTIGAEFYNDAAMFYLNETSGVSTPALAKGIHPTRLVVYKGEVKHMDVGVIASMEDYWGNSTIKSKYVAINALHDAYTNAGALLFKARTSILHTDAFVKNAQTVEGSQKNAALLNMFLRNSTNTGINMIGKGMEYKEFNTPLAGLEDIIETFARGVARAFGIPETKFLGTSASGIGNTGNDSIRHYYDSLRSYQTLVIGTANYHLDKLIQASAGIISQTPITYKWNNLYTLTEQEQAISVTSELRNIVTLQKAGGLTLDELRELGLEIIAKQGSVLENPPKSIEQPVDNNPQPAPE